jgi:hypothetical protein
MTALAKIKKPSNALRHGAYSTTALLPGESSTDYERVRQGLVNELKPQGPLEEHVVGNMAQLLWRRQNLHIFRRAEAVRKRRHEIIRGEMRRRDLREAFAHLHEDANQAAREEATRAGEQLARTEIGDEYALIENDIVTEDRLMVDLAIQERIDVLIDRCIKRLLMLRGFKSMENFATGDAQDCKLSWRVSVEPMMAASPNERTPEGKAVAAELGHIETHALPTASIRSPHRQAPEAIQVPRAQGPWQS